ncbi:MAG: hypothetical protein MUF37_03660, partial [Methanoregulaceae archaeon]|nr:hypothetical protein [Methanoregulaceae archaeon]
HTYPDIPPVIHNAADKKIKKIRDSYGSVILSLDLEDIELYIDGQKRGVLGTPLAITAGNHRVEIKKGNTTISTEIVPVEAKSNKTVKLPLGKKSVHLPAVLNFSADTIVLALFVSVVILPVLMYQQTIWELVLIAALGGITLYGLAKQKKWGLILLGGAYIAMLSKGGYVLWVSLIALVGIGIIYWKFAHSWEWK